MYFQHLILHWMRYVLLIKLPDSRYQNFITYSKEFEACPVNEEKLANDEETGDVTTNSIVVCTNISTYMQQHSHPCYRIYSIDARLHTRLHTKGEINWKSGSPVKYHQFHIADEITRMWLLNMTGWRVARARPWRSLRTRHSVCTLMVALTGQPLIDIW